MLRKDSRFLAADMFSLAGFLPEFNPYWEEGRKKLTSLKKKNILDYYRKERGRKYKFKKLFMYVFMYLND